MGEPSVLGFTETHDGVRYDLFRGTESSKCAVRVTDVDSGNTVGIKQFSNFMSAHAYWEQSLPQATQESTTPPLGTITTHDTGSAMVGM